MKTQRQIWTELMSMEHNLKSKIHYIFTTLKAPVQNDIKRLLEDEYITRAGIRQMIRDSVKSYKRIIRELDRELEVLLSDLEDKQIEVEDYLNSVLEELWFIE